ncbi:surface-adhesin E family protein [Variovorax sp. TBS-050B]|uniref:surface-adhesin E family protein n=1 Tax=Variovorax sp. TBS-050B TaxID=2940551 RepID=UPI0024743A22|nr:surface-adhesin E family protein [Variovorax sp. TBS-050B]
MTKHLPLLLALTAGWPAHAEWLTLGGSAGDAGNSYVQVDPTSVVVDGTKRLMAVRLSLAAPRVTRDGIKFRSFSGQASIDCEARSARYVGATYFAQPNFVGEPIAVKVFEPDDVRPMNFDGAPGDLATRTVNAACGVTGTR